MTLGSARIGRCALIVRCKECGHQVKPDRAEMAARYGAETPVLDWRERLVCSKCDSRQVDMVVSGTKRRQRQPSHEPTPARGDMKVSTQRTSEGLHPHGPTARAVDKTAYRYGIVETPAGEPGFHKRTIRLGDNLVDRPIAQTTRALVRFRNIG